MRASVILEETKRSLPSYAPKCSGISASRRQHCAANSNKDAKWGSRRVTRRSYCVVADNPGPLVYVGTNTWILFEEDRECCAIVDPGPLDSRHFADIERIIAKEKKSVGVVLLTHDHADHAEGAAAFASRFGVPLLCRRKSTLPDGPIALGRDLPLLEIISLPGHSSDSVGIVFPSDRSIVTGDVLFKQSSTLIDWPDGTLVDYMESLVRLRQAARRFDIERLLTGHGPVVDNPLGAIMRQETHRLNRLCDVLRFVTTCPDFDTGHVVSEVYGGENGNLSAAVCQNVEAQLDFLKRKGLIPGRE